MKAGEYFERLEQRLEAVVATGIVHQAALPVHTMVVERIFGRGQKATGAIGRYSTKPFYAGAVQFAKHTALNAKGKSGKTVFKNGKPHKTMYLPQGYKQLKETQGLEGGFVNLTYTASLKNDFATSLVSSGGMAVSGFNNQADIEKAEALKKKYGNDLFALTDGELKLFATETGRRLTGFLFK
ncbi:MAG TPA: hypothetical protein VG603_08455 [Chitinophagales bacterium]|nr:hypothetical protein [Chitinophagales bacterium]